MRNYLLVLLALVSLSCQSKKEKSAVVATEPLAEVIVESAEDILLEKERALAEAQLSQEKAKEEELRAEKEMKVLEQKRLEEEKAKKKAVKRRKAAAQKKAAKEKRPPAIKAKQPDISKIKPDTSDLMTTVNPGVKKQIIKKENLEQLTEIAFRRNFYSFGEIVEGDTIDFSFSFTNIGEHPLYIKSATATCGCTHPSYSFLPVEPGGKGEITGMYVSTGKHGPQNPMVMVKSNTDPIAHKLYLDGTVIDKPLKEVGNTPEAVISTDSLSIGG